MLREVLALTFLASPTPCIAALLEAGHPGFPGFMQRRVGRSCFSSVSGKYLTDVCVYTYMYCVCLIGFLSRVLYLVHVWWILKFMAGSEGSKLAGCYGAGIVDPCA